MSIAGKVTVITGATGNLGAAVTSRFLADGARAALVYQDEGKLQALLPQLPEAGQRLALKADVTDEVQVERLMGEVHERLGGPDILLNLVGGYTFGKKVVDLDLATWEHMMSLNLTSMFLCCRHALRHMLAQGYGRVVNVSSKAALDLPAGAAAYAVAKAGVTSFTTCLAHELKGSGASVAAIMPSIIDTPATRAAMPKADFSKWVKPEEIAQAMAYLASDEGGAMNGAIVPLFGAL